MNMTETWYKVYLGLYEVRPVSVVSFTEKTVTLLRFGRPSRENRIRADGDVGCFPTWEEAHAFLLERAEREVASLRARLQTANGRVGSIRGMKPPTT